MSQVENSVVMGDREPDGARWQELPTCFLSLYSWRNCSVGCDQGSRQPAGTATKARAQALAGKGLSMRSAAAQLQAEDRQTSKGGRWSPKQVAPAPRQVALARMGLGSPRAPWRAAGRFRPSPPTGRGAGRHA
jgi:hypothetical protein